MHRVGSAGNTASSTRPRKEKRFTYVLNDADDTKVFFLQIYLSIVRNISCLYGKTSCFPLENKKDPFQRLQDMGSILLIFYSK